VSPRINTTVARKERTIAPPDFMKRAKAISAFYRILGQSFEALKQPGFGKIRRISGKQLLIRGD